jgi:hypothetical protein
VVVIANDAVGEHGFDRANTELALTGAVLGEVREPQLVRSISAELSLHEVGMHGRTVLARLPAFLRSCRRDVALLRAQPPHSQLPYLIPEIGELVCDEPIPERRRLGMRIKRSVRQLGVVPITR